MFKVNNRNTGTRCEICSRLTIKTQERRQFRRSGVFVVNFEHHRWRSEIYPYARISFRNRITNMLLVPAMHAGCDSVSSFSHIKKITTSQTLKKQNRRTDKYDRLRWFPSLSLVRLPLLQFNMHATFMKIINQAQAWMNSDIECLPKRIWAEIVYHQL